MLDAALVEHEHLMSGVVVDLGGKKTNKRGAFRPPESAKGRWIDVNLDPAVSPDIVADVQDVPIKDATADCVLSTEVIEHLPDPAACVLEAHRILKPGGVLILSAPFLHPVHGDPHDFQRFTADGLRRLCAVFETTDVTAMGGYTAVLSSVVDTRARQIRSLGPAGAIVRKSIRLFARILFRFGNRGWAEDGEPAFTTGYFVVCRKSGAAEDPEK
jgi:SAM-dependent methyltransferase